MTYTIHRAAEAFWCEACGTHLASGAIFWKMEPGAYLLCGGCAIRVGAVERRVSPESVGDRVERLA